MNKLIRIIDEHYYINSLYKIKITFIDIEPDITLNHIYNYLITYTDFIKLNKIIDIDIIEFKYKNKYYYDIMLFNNKIILSLIP